MLTFPSPYDVLDAVRSTYLRYIDTAFALRDRSLTQERTELLLKGQGSIFAPMMLEPVLPYDGVATLDETAILAGVPRDVLRQVGGAVFGVDSEHLSAVSLREHQVDALRTHFSSSQTRNAVITSGTGSGKTESFLIPLLTRLSAEAKVDPGVPSAHEWWTVARQNEPWQPVRRDSKRRPAMRAMVLYPTNALVEDQLARLRRSIRALRRAPDPIDLWVGRYTGATPGSGAPPSGALGRGRGNQVAHEVRQMVRELGHV